MFWTRWFRRLYLAFPRAIEMNHNESLVEDEDQTRYALAT
jgi:hypothetical protein